MNRLTDNADAYRRRAMSRRRQFWVLGFILLLVPILVLALLVANFNPNRYQPAIIAAVEHATGRQLTLGSPMTLKLSLDPVIEASQISLANPPGFAAPEFFTLGRVEAKIALLPLLSHRLDILQLTLVNPKIVLERDKSGRPDWDFSPQSPSSAPAGPAQPGQGYKIALKTVSLQNGTLILADAAAKPLETIAIQNFSGNAATLDAPLGLSAAAALGGTPFTVQGEVGPVSRFSGQGTAPWPVNLTLAFAGATGTVKGSIAQPRLGRGYDLNLQLAIPALAAVAQALPPGLLGGFALPPVQNVTAQARIIDQNSTIPAIDGLVITAGASDLSSLRPGLKLAGLHLAMAALDQPLSLAASGQINRMPLDLAANFGSPQALLNPALLPASMPPQGSYPATLTAHAGAADFSLNGAIATPRTLAGAAFSLNASIPDLSALGPLAGPALPAWKNIAAQTTITDPGGLGLRNAVGLDDLAVTMDHAAFGGAGSLYFGAAPRLQAALSLSSVNADALAAAWPAAPPGAMPAQNPPAAPPQNPPAAPPQNPPAAPPLFTLPMSLLKTASADLQLSAGTLTWRQASYSALQAHAVLANGVLTLNPVTGIVPGGGFTASATVNATAEPAAERLNLDAPALALAPVLKTFGLPDDAQGTMQLKLAATATGDTLAAMRQSLGGQLGLAMVNGIVDGRVMDQIFGALLGAAGLPDSLAGAQGPAALRCMALRMDAANGTGTVRALTLDSSRLLVQGGGSVDFGNQTLALILRPQLQVAGVQVGVPVQITGSFAAPSTGIAPAGAVAAAAKTAVGLPVDVAGQVFGANTLFGKAAGALGLGTTADVCPPALALARLGAPGPAAAPLAPPVTAPGAAPNAAPAPNGPRSLLNSLLGP